ncbi:ATP-dependent RNA helicase, putative, partial [Candida maltosa Xu316]
MTLTGVEKLVLVGDEKQLSCFSQIPDLAISLFERILKNGTCKEPFMLDTQYRMHPAISEFPRHEFYNGELKDGINESARSMNKITKPVFFWDTYGEAPEEAIEKRRKSDGFTYTNTQEI